MSLSLFLSPLSALCLSPPLFLSPLSALCLSPPLFLAPLSVFLSLHCQLANSVKVDQMTLGQMAHGQMTWHQRLSMEKDIFENGLPYLRPSLTENSGNCPLCPFYSHGHVSRYLVRLYLPVKYYR